MPLRFPKGSDVKLTSPTFTNLDEEAADLTTGVPTVSVVSARTGATLSAPTAVDAGVGVYTCTLTAATHLAEVDELTVTWTGTVSGAARTLTQTVQVAGGVYVPVVDLRAVGVLSSATNYPAAILRHYRTLIEDICEEALGTAYVPRLAVESFVGDGASIHQLAHRNPRSVVSVAIDGVAQTAADFGFDGGWLVSEAGRFTRPADNAANITVVYEHGYSQPPVALIEAAKEYVRAKATANKDSYQRGVLSVTNLATDEVTRFSTANWGQKRWTGIEEVDERINSVPAERALVA